MAPEVHTSQQESLCPTMRVFYQKLKVKDELDESSRFVYGDDVGIYRFARLMWMITLEALQACQNLTLQISQMRSAETAVHYSERIFTELIRSIERSRSEVTQMIRDQEKTAVSRAEGRLGQEINDLRRRDAELEQLSHTQDHIQFLQSFQSLSAPPESTDVPNIPFCSLFSFDGIRESVHQLRDKLEDFCKEELKKISDRVTMTNIVPRTRNDFLQYFHQLTLDLNTVNKCLCLSERNRVIKYTGTKQPYPDHPDRFDVFQTQYYTQSHPELYNPTGQHGVSVSARRCNPKIQKCPALLGTGNNQNAGLPQVWGGPQNILDTAAIAELEA
ncbi:tripartite motif-containing protein 16-like protein [Sinocyclocheilus anshuiensis]|uniref:tripartite motif-containing protein 16-like protein n=1 Tax=Sinocyclocheilus anshuiensis TaxID=1608454 RepID=UPI0007BA6E6B|nr:PREDICTED: tripartite motif-containing protein 16-like protein [Sinocyclocheilus anshuiensis]